MAQKKVAIYEEVDDNDARPRKVLFSSLGGGASAWGGITGTLSAQADLNSALGGKAAASHAHAVGDTTGLQTALDGKQAVGSYAATSHAHAIADTTGLQTALDGKQAAGSYSLTSHDHAGVYSAAGHNHSGVYEPADATILKSAHIGVSVQASGSYSLTSHDHAGVYSASGQDHSGVYEPAFSKNTGFNKNFGAAAGTVTQGDDARLSDARTPVAHNHDASAINAGTVATARLGSGSASGTTFLRGDQTWATPAGGADPWTYVILGSDFTNSTTGNNVIAGLSFTPAANTRYMIEANLLMRTATATSGPRPGFSWPGGITDGGAWMQAPNSATASAQRWWGPRNTQNAASTGVPDTTNSHMGIGGALLLMGASPTGSFQVTLAAETSGVVATMKAGSFIRYRTY